LFNGEYFFQRSDPEHPESPGSYNGLEYSQLLGQSWAYQVGLGEILDPAKVTTHLRSLWKYNFTTDVGPYREKYTNGRWFALPGEGGIIACTWPRGGDEVLGLGNRHFAGYLNECQPGYEWAVTSLMMWHGMPYHALAHARTMFDRYLGSKRNPWNEVEWGDHYSRSMASYGVFTAVCGFEYSGPQGYIAFSPRITPNRFKAAFTTAKGWGTFAQERRDGTQRDTLDVRWGELSVRTLAFDLPAGKKSTAASVNVSDRKIPAHMETRDNRVMIHLQDKLKIAAGERLTIVIPY
jgi:Glycosyl-hydrolase family 116, catalytic region